MMKIIHVFKTSVRNNEQVEKLSPVLNGLLGRHERWNFDLEDIDNILRVETFMVEPGLIINSLTGAGFICAELED